jgi:exonuclease SbcC
MKIKSVKITGFRAFAKEENSTFDFTKGSEIMNFASIYAPNGFGKTSFYDAVEWGITHKIQRFDRMVDFEKIRKDNDAPLLLNKASSSGKVIVETSSQKFENVINTKKVYKYNEKPANEYFQNQILTQDLIDAILKEEKAEDRYTKFLEIDNNLKKYDAVYKKINTLLGYINDERKELIKSKGKEEAKIQAEIDFEEEFKKFDELNEVIADLNKENESLKSIEQRTFNQTAYDNLSRNIDVRLLSLEEQLVKIKLRTETLILARDGEKSEEGKVDGGILLHLDNKTKILKLDEQLKELNLIVKLFEEQEKVNHEFSTNDKDLESQQKRLDQALNIEKRLETFLSIQKEIDSLQKEIADIKDKILSAEREKFDAENEKKEKLTKLNKLKSNLENTQSKLNNIPAQKTQLELIAQAIFDLQKTIDDLSKSIDTEEKKQNDLRVTLDEFAYFESMVIDDTQFLLEFKLFDDYKELVTRLVSDEIKLKKLIKDVQEIQSKIDKQTKFNKELSDFVSSGLELANKSQSSNCPLCNQDYGTFEKLSESILSNELLGSQLKRYLEEKTETEVIINKLMLDLSADKDSIKKVLSSIKAPFLSDYKNIQSSIDKLTSERKFNLEKLNSTQSILNDINLSLGDTKTFEELSVKVHDELSKINNQIAECSNQIKINEDILSEKETFIQSSKEKLSISESSLLKHQSSKDYIEVREYFLKELNATIEKSTLSENISNIQLTIADLTRKKERIINDLKELKINLSIHPLSKDEYIQKSQQVNDIKNMALRVYESYENYMQSEFGMEIGDKDKRQIEEAFIDLIARQRQLEKLTETKIEKYKIVRILNDACIKATESKIIQNQIEAINGNLKKLGSAEKELNNEKENLKGYLKGNIEAYFYTSLINSIYKKIDPHPDYKEIEFECDFAENKPRLQIYTTSLDESGKVLKSVPSLYFSTAQVNILSLSIFLARALKTKDDKGQSVDCIFIDDPIQSMDSINILSFIDLFRGLTLSLDKQLIVSTHEENFHLLLQKKIPSRLFKSTFIEFESFGKLKQVI